MRAGVSSRGGVFASMGCLGWLILGPFIITGWLAWTLLVLSVQGIRWAAEQIRDIRANGY